jgi:hypothetical protein
MMLAARLPRTLGFLMYREYEDGASIEELSAALRAPVEWVEERIEAARLCIEKQIRIELRPVPRARPRRASVRRFNTGSESKRRSL